MPENPPQPRLFLASRSPRRAELLTRLGVPFELLDVELAESPGPGEAAADYVRRLAREKAGAGLLQVAAVPGVVVLGSDTEVELDGQVFGKPAGPAQAVAMLRRLAGRSHRVLTAVCLVSAGREAEALSVSELRFAPLDEAQIAAYVATGEPFGKAGGYALQGRAGAFVQHLSGSSSGVIGLPLYETSRLLAEFGIAPGPA
ncbi:MAG: septum formation inhibitor Maf [Xanthomonadales bacterium]|nr:septum formation inhibitor Maf [Xanthomonadales bacterium]